MKRFNDSDIKQLERVLIYCGNGGDCDKCEFNWMEDHGEWYCADGRRKEIDNNGQD